MKLLAAALAALAFPASASAALEVKLSLVAEQPGERSLDGRPTAALLDVQTARRKLLPAEAGRRPLSVRVEAVSPTGRVMARRHAQNEEPRRLVGPDRLQLRRAMDATRAAVGPALQHTLRCAATYPSQRRLSRRAGRLGGELRDLGRRRPDLDPAASSASFFACAVPDEPEMIAPAWPIVFPGGAVKPAM